MTGPTGQGPRGPRTEEATTAGGSAQAIAFVGLVALPVLAFVSAVMGLVLVLNGKTVAGLVFLLALTQAFAIGGLALWMRRRREHGQR